jgi:4-diphosphocytidyl-2-C-methyl-D-erythritol kinase
VNPGRDVLQGFPAPAKLNLMLRIVGRRADGYHLLQTVFRFIDHGDTVRVRVRTDGRITRLEDIPGVPEENDLSIRAARLLQDETGCRLGADIEVVKRIPMGGGLGGGSSDAASVLMALNALWATGLSRRNLMALGLTLGADVPVFVFGQSAFAEGVGEVLAPIALPPAWYVVLTPSVAVATPWVFGHPELKRDSQRITIQGFSVVDAVNDLEPLVCREFPEVARHIEWLGGQPGLEGRAIMTGSGASVFAAFDTEDAARRVYDSMPDDMRGFLARGLDRHPLHSLVT